MEKEYWQRKKSHIFPGCCLLKMTSQLHNRIINTLHVSDRKFLSFEKAFNIVSVQFSLS